MLIRNLPKADPYQKHKLYRNIEEDEARVGVEWMDTYLALLAIEVTAGSQRLQSLQHVRDEPRGNWPMTSLVWIWMLMKWSHRAIQHGTVASTFPITNSRGPFNNDQLQQERFWLSLMLNGISIFSPRPSISHRLPLTRNTNG